MIADLSPELAEGEYVFFEESEGVRARRLALTAIGIFREPEGISLILPIEVALREGNDVGLPMRMITLKVYSALDGVGLTAAVAAALSSRGIACNMVAAFRHDYVFIPSARAKEAFEALRELQRSAASS